jgi:hypothetical protein
MNGITKVVLGYVVSIITASAATVSILSTSEPASLGTFLSLMLFGGAYVATCGLPGFVLTITAARKNGWHSPLVFAVAGGLNAVAAWITLFLFAGNTIGLGEPLFRASVLGGIAGGLAYWSVAVKTRDRVPEAA